MKDGRWIKGILEWRQRATKKGVEDHRHAG